MYQTATKFLIKSERLPALLAALKSLEAGRWVNESEIDRATTVEEILCAWRWSPTVNEDSDLVDLFFMGEKYGDESALFNTLAPYVEDGSFIEMRGEDGGQWRYYFSEGECREIDAVISWPGIE
jgi:hypothetical protein